MRYMLAGLFLVVAVFVVEEFLYVTDLHILSMWTILGVAGLGLGLFVLGAVLELGKVGVDRDDED